MRIQHNIAAMNSYRNYNNNVKSVNTNLEKLSSGYKINRAGDDAAGLAISEKMRAQITGLEAASKNVKDATSLVKTAEGAMQEIQDMLNRMDYLATQSANGTYDNEVDRANLQKEVESLKSEINRIADSSNFNGIKLLDGSLSTDGGITSANNFTTSLALSETPATQGKYTLTANVQTVTKGDVLEYTIGIESGSGKGFSVKIEFNDDCSKALYNGKEYTLTTKKTVSASEMSAILADAMKDALGNDFTVKDANGTIEVQNKVAGTDAPRIGQAIVFKQTRAGTVSSVAGLTAATTNAATDSQFKFAASQIKVCTSASKIADSIFTVNGKQVAVVKDDTVLKDIENKNIYCIVSTSAADDAVAAELSQITGLEITQDGTNFTVASGTAKTGSGLTLQIGDTADSFNQMQVSIGDMHTKAMGIANIDISTQDGAAAAIQVVKDAINYVSSVRGDLGAIQNRLDHTANNLSVMTENIQDAESTIRDTDVAEEMMAYTKNNILVQSAQAMLAQANQIPQGVLQLLG